MISSKTLSLHNAYRAQHGAPALQWCSQLERAAKEHATHLAYKNLPVASKPDTAFGQNLFELTNEGGAGDDVGAVEKAIESWYESRSQYTLGEDGNPVGNRGLSFTQMVWKETQRVGLGVAFSGDRKRAVVIAFYDPRGNCGGEFSSSVQKYTTLEQKTSTTNLVSNLNLNDSSSRNTGTTNNTKNTCTNTTDHNTNGAQQVETVEGSKEVVHTIHISTSSTSSTTRNEARTFQDSVQTEHSVQTDSVHNTDKSIQSDQNNSQRSVDTDRCSNTTTGNNTTTTTGLGRAASPAEAAALELHNQLRRKHGVGPMKLDQKLCETAAIQATSLLSGNKAQGHLGLMNVGQNVYQTTGIGTYKDKDATVVAVTSAIEQWYSHHKEYNWQNPLNSGKYAGNFSQLVWKSSESLGVAVANRGELTIVVCLYSEQGNIQDVKSHKENVLNPAA